jgi:hypothetical protein
VTVTASAEPFSVHTRTVKSAVCPCRTLALARCTLTHSTTCGDAELGAGVGLADAALGVSAAGSGWHCEVALAASACLTARNAMLAVAAPEARTTVATACLTLITGTPVRTHRPGPAPRSRTTPHGCNRRSPPTAAALLTRRRRRTAAEQPSSGYRTAEAHRKQATTHAALLVKPDSTPAPRLAAGTDARRRHRNGQGT